MKKILFSLFIGVALVFVIYKYNEEKSIYVGFIGGLSGKYSNLGHDVLNGLTLALEERNYKIGKENIILVTKDDKQDEQSAKDAIESLLKDNINIIIGNTTSSMAKITLPYINDRNDTVLISPTVSSNEFSNIDDNFLRTQVAHSTKRFDKLSNYLLKKNLTKIYMIYDPLNKSYVDNYLVNFQSSFISSGGEKFIAMNKITMDYNELLTDIKSKQIDAITIVANSVDSAKFIQFLRLNGVDNLIISSGWAKTKDFLESGGKAVEGVLFSTGYDDNSQNKNYLKFVESYRKKYLDAPSIFAAQSYETGIILYDALLNVKNASEIKKYILKKKEFDGLQGKIIFNEYGDVEREYFLMMVQNNQFIKLEDINEK